MFYKSVMLTSLAMESVCLVYIGPSTRVGKIEVGTKVLRSGRPGFVPTSNTRLPIGDLESVNMEYQRQVDKAMAQGFTPSWTRPAAHIKARQLTLNFGNV